ncbi:hypothetical protein [Botrimarina hoheduenensis]|uniref:Uncharacterized protein n=1 Tax=Botrimarina hoheduenensis TaxID=2528000 RepID=A0A5C5W8Z5_9BACT|nr:hypothetical protein [Botrimarina hoheduenensis]TWT47356.1 hypothetical protein Pla111_09690 [Botrimarina hoheduenensis]
MANLSPSTPDDRPADGDHADDRYGPLLSKLITGGGAHPWQAGEPVDATELAGLDPLTVLSPAAMVDPPMADCCLAGLWLLYNDLERAHVLCQEVPTATGSFWHGVVHRREGDFDNARYWFTRAASHPAIRSIAEAVAADATARDAFPNDWTPAAMVTACERLASGDTALEKAVVSAQRAEWHQLFKWTFHAATVG